MIVSISLGTGEILGFSSNDGENGPTFQFEERIFFDQHEPKIFQVGWKISQFLPSSIT